MKSLKKYILEASSNDVYVYIEIPHGEALPYISQSTDVVFVQYSKTHTKKAHVYKLDTDKSQDEIEDIFKKVYKQKGWGDIRKDKEYSDEIFKIFKGDVVYLGEDLNTKEIKELMRKNF